MTDSDRRVGPSTRVERPRRGEEGFALVAAIGVAVVCLLLATTVVAVAVRSGTSTGLDRAHAQASAAAEAGVDAAVIRLRTDLQPSTQSGFDCTLPARTVWASPGSSSVTVTYAFTNSAGAAATCPLVNGASYAKATITSTAVYTFGAVTTRRSMTAVVGLNYTGSGPSSFPNAIFTDAAPSALTSSYSFSTKGDVYTNGAYACQGSFTVTGTITAQAGYTQLGGACFVSGGVRTAASTPAPPVQSMPALTYPATPWSGATVVPASSLPGVSGCTVTGSLTWGSTSTSTIVDARSCSPLVFTGSTALFLRGDVSIYAGSISTASSSSTSVGSSDSVAHVLRLIVPAQSPSNVCGAGGGDITLQGSVAVGSPIKAFLYTPGKLAATGSSISLSGASMTSCRSAWSGSLNLTYASAPPPADASYAPSAASKTDVSTG